MAVRAPRDDPPDTFWETCCWCSEVATLASCLACRTCVYCAHDSAKKIGWKCEQPGTCVPLHCPGCAGLVGVAEGTRSTELEPSGISLCQDCRGDLYGNKIAEIRKTAIYTDEERARYLNLLAWIAGFSGAKDPSTFDEDTTSCHTEYAVRGYITVPLPTQAGPGQATLAVVLKLV